MYVFFRGFTVQCYVLYDTAYIFIYINTKWELQLQILRQAFVATTKTLKMSLGIIVSSGRHESKITDPRATLIFNFPQGKSYLSTG